MTASRPHSASARSARASTPAEAFDVVVVGGGINGAATARDAAMRGLSVLLVEKEDLSHAASAWNSRMIHGGIKYLETYEFDLVRESLREREWLVRSAPHLVRPLPFLMPFMKGNRRPPWLLRMGMLGYDLLSLRKSLPNHRVLDRTAVLEIAPGLVPGDVRGGALFYDAQAEYAERLGVETALSAHQHGASIHTHTQASKLILQGRRVRAIELVDVLDGRRWTVETKVVVNASGAWLDELLAGTPGHGRPLITGSKGTHLVVDAFEGAPREALYYEARADGRPVLVIPWLGRYLIGATDVRVDGHMDEVIADGSEIDYILAETNALIPAANLRPGDVRFVYTGVRPLPYEPTGDVGKISRHHKVFDHAPQIEGLLSLVGGKLTTFRAMGEDAADAIMRKLGRQERSRTREESLPGGRGDLAEVADHLTRDSAMDPAIIERLIRIYGVRAAEVVRLAESEPRQARVVDERHGMLVAEITLATDVEFARTVADVLMRRTMVGLDPELDVASVEAVADVMADGLDWSASRRVTEIDRYLALAQRHRPFARSRSATDRSDELMLASS